MKEFDFNTVALLATNFGYIIAGVIIAYIVCKKKLNEYFKGIEKNLNVGYKIPRQVKKDVEIIRRMEQLKEMLNADRVQVYEFHNGEHYANGRSALKFSCTYEVYRVSISSTQSKMNSIPISCVPQFITQLLEEESIRVPNVEAIKDKMPSAYELITNLGVTSYQMVVIKNQDNDPVGFISVQWCEGHKMTTDEKELYRLAAFVEERILADINR